MTSTSVMQGRATTISTEWDILYTTPRFVGDQNTHGVLYFHGSGATALSVYSDAAQRPLISKVSRNANVLSADFALQSFGSDTMIARAVEAMDWMEAQGWPGPFTLIGASMGAGNAFAVTHAHPDRVAKLALMIPLIDLNDVYTTKGYASQINAAYGHTYVDAVDGPAHNPLRMAATLPADLPIHLWCANDDPLAEPQFAQAFVTARPQTGITWVGNLGHTDASMAAATPELVDFVHP